MVSHKLNMLVKRAREKGFQAWALQKSEYRLDNHVSAACFSEGLPEDLD